MQSDAKQPQFDVIDNLRKVSTSCKLQLEKIVDEWLLMS